ncbi:MAG: helix-turn-helix transcriptional regulator [Candidatus Aminicenantes bacterium]|nr:helix-turn-helix transcriptional regulator [Candidatus Aminicenantes bacterium]
MKLLTRAEEMILLSILRLKDNAYCVPIFDEIQRITQKKWTMGGIYIPLYRLEKNGYVGSHLGQPTAERGGKSKRFYWLTPKGLKSLEAIKKIEKAMWEGLTQVGTD